MTADPNTFDVDALDFAKGDGLVTVVVQDERSGAVLMVAHADREAVERTIASGEMHFRSRSRGPWHKGGTSGNVQQVVSMSMDCDSDAILARVRSAGPACHTGARSCFGELALDADTLGRLDAVIASRSTEQDSAGDKPSYTRRLLGDRNLRLKKLGEEMAELITACADADGNRAAEEAGDVVYHMLVALRSLGVSLDDIRRTLSVRTS